MENKTLETMTVKELKEESRNRGLKLESKGHKFTKAELIDNIKKHDAEQKDIQKAIDEAGEDEAWNMPEQEEQKEEVKQELEKKDEDYIVFAKTLEEIEKKYANRKKQEIYDNELKTGSLVVFVHYVEALDGNIYKKLRTAKVIGINRKKELVRVITLLGTEKELSFDDLLYIRGNAVGCSYPKDISTYLKNQRTEKGKVLINEKFTKSESDVTN